MPGLGVAGECLGVPNRVNGVGVSRLMQGNVGLSRGAWIGGMAWCGILLSVCGGVG
jgi:hypothetical protein